LRTLRGTKRGDWDVAVEQGERLIRGRICAIKKSRQAAERARRQAYRDNSRKGHTVSPETLEAAEYVFVFTTLDRTSFSAAAVLELYRGRWQIEMVFKRLKSIIGLGHLKKTDLEAAKAWIHGKLLVAFLVEALLTAGEKFSPWGYPICEEPQDIEIPLEGNILDASPC
jgi:transposase